VLDQLRLELIRACTELALLLSVPQLKLRFLKKPSEVAEMTRRPTDETSPLTRGLRLPLDNLAMSRFEGQLCRKFARTRHRISMKYKRTICPRGERR
jgi:hypothetical protein